MSIVPDNDTLVVGTRGSKLALAQTRGVVERLRAAHPGLLVRLAVITTAGDRLSDQPLPEIGGKGLFTAELERALLDGTIDLAVHSAKDLPTEQNPALAALAYPPREDPRDAWVAADNIPFAQLPPNSVVGTGSLRRQAQLLMHRGDLQFVNLRGNVDTRIRKVRRGGCAATVLAMAGLNRLGLSEQVTHPFEPGIMLPAPGQGALALQGRTGDRRVAAYLPAVHDADTAAAVECERAVLRQLQAGCRAPVAVYTLLKNGYLICSALVADPQGRLCVRAEARRPKTESADAVEEVVSQLRRGGADQIIAACRP